MFVPRTSSSAREVVVWFLAYDGSDFTVFLFKGHVELCIDLAVLTPKLCAFLLWYEMCMDSMCIIMYAALNLDGAHWHVHVILNVIM